VREIWETAFAEKQMMWGDLPASAAVWTGDAFAQSGVKQVLIPGVGYGRNAKPFLERNMSVTGIEISATAIGLARSRMQLSFPIHHGSVTAMPFDAQQYDGIFCFGMIYLLDAAGRAKMLDDCTRQLAHGGQMVFTVISKDAPMYGLGPKLGDDWYERFPGMPMFFYDRHSIEREFGSHGLADFFNIDEPSHGGSLPFIQVVCKKS
jgi:SAM-dependent methyltransferase